MRELRARGDVQKWTFNFPARSQVFGEISELMSSQEEPFGNSNVSFLIIITVKMRDGKVERRELETGTTILGQE